MKILILLRHAKSDWDNGAATDHERPLNKRGRASAPRIGQYLAGAGYSPDQILLSDAARTVETWDRMAHHFPDAPPPTLHRDLYLAPPAAMLARASSATGKTVLMVGHNPGIGELAEALAATAPPHPRFFDYPTCATTVFRFDTLQTWKDLPERLASGQVLDFITPRDL